MPDNLQDVLNKIDTNGDLPPKEEIIEPPVDEVVEETVDEVVEDEVVEETVEDEVAEDPIKETKTTKPEDTSVIKNLRTQYKQTKQEADEYKKKLERIAELQGMSVEELEADLQSKADEKEAKEKNISPEIQAQLRQQEEKIRALETSQKREQFDLKITKLQVAESLTDSDLEDFVNKAITAGIDLTNPRVDFESAYFALNHKTVLQKIREEERQKVLSEIERQKTKAPSKTSKTGNTDGGKKGLRDLYADLVNQGL